MVLLCVSYLDVGLSNSKPANLGKVVPLEDRVASIFAFRSLPTAPKSHLALRLPVWVLPIPSTGSLPKSRLIFNLFGMIVSTLILFSKTAPPTFIFACQLPVGDDASVLVLKR